MSKGYEASDEEDHDLSAPALLRWCNEKLTASGHRALASLHSGIADGISLVRLAETLSKRQMKSTIVHPSSRQERVHNLRLALSVLSDEGVCCQHVSPQDLEEGNTERLLELMKAIVNHYSDDDDKPPLHISETSDREKRKNGGRIEVDGLAKTQLISKLRDLLSSSNSSSSAASSSTSHNLSDSSSPDTTPNGSSKRRSGSRIGRSLSFRRFTGGLRASDENGTRMDRSHSLSRDSVNTLTTVSNLSGSVSPVSSLAISTLRYDRFASDECNTASKVERFGSHDQLPQRSRQNSPRPQSRERRSSSSSSTGGNSRRSSIGRSEENTRTQEASADERFGSENSPRLMEGDKRESDESNSAKEKKKMKKKKKKKKKEKSFKKDKKGQGKTDKKDKARAKEKSNRTELKRSVSWYKASGKSSDRIGMAVDERTQTAEKQQKSRSFRNLFQILNFSQEMKTNSRVSKHPAVPVDAGSVRTKRSPSLDNPCSGSKSCLGSSNEHAAVSRVPVSFPPSPIIVRHQHSSSMSASSTPTTKDPRLTVSAENLAGSFDRWGPSQRLPSERRTGARDKEESRNDESSKGGHPDDEDEDENSDDDDEGDVDDSEADLDVEDNMIRSVSPRHPKNTCDSMCAGDISIEVNTSDIAEDTSKHKEKNKKNKKNKKKKKKKSASTEKSKKKRRKSELTLERRVADIERLRTLVDQLNDQLAGQPVLAQSRADKDCRETSDTLAIGETMRPIWRVDTMTIVAKVIEVMQQARSIFHSCPDEVQRADILFMARQLNSSLLRLADVLDAQPDYDAIGAFVQHRIELSAAGLELVVACGLPEEWMRAYAEDDFLSDSGNVSVGGTDDRRYAVEEEGDAEATINV